MEQNPISVSNTRNTNGNSHASLALVPLSDMQQMAKIGVESNFFGIKKPTEAMALMLIAQAEGKHPATVFSQYHVIQGRPALKADAMLARFQQAGGAVQWTERTDKACAATFSHPQGGKCEVRWTLDDAKRAGLLNGKSNWTQYPRQMLSARVVSEGVRAVFPGVLGGFYTPEEVSQFEAPKFESAPRLTDEPQAIEAEVIDVVPEPVEQPRIISRELVSGKTTYAEPVPKKKPASAPIDGSEMTEATFLGMEEKHGNGKKGPWTCYKATLEINGRKLYPSTFEADLGAVLSECEEGDSVMVKLEERPYTDRNGETKKGYDLVFVTKANVPAKAEDAEELDEIPF
jgi:hypothetical protein